MRRLFLALAIVGSLMSVARTTSADYYIEYYRDNLFLGLAYHRIGCITDWNTIQSSQDYDGFTNTRYCNVGATAESVPNASWYDYKYLGTTLSTVKSQLDTCGARTNLKYGTANYAASSTTCSYNVFANCNSDCWIRHFSICTGKEVGIVSPCPGFSYP